MNLILKPITTLEEVEQLRVFRNECKDFMTRSKNVIEPKQQQEWWNNCDKEKNKLYLLHKIVNGVIGYPVGYGYIRIENDEVLLTGGLTEKERDKGHGKILFYYLIKNSEQFDLPIKLEVLKYNTRAFLVYNSLGFRVVSDDGEIITMVYDKKRVTGDVL